MPRMRARDLVRNASRLFVVAAVGIGIAIGGAQAAEVTQEQAMQNVLAKPYDAEVSYAYAELATKNGDLRGAANALERVLLVYPTANNIRLELGTIYYRLGSYELAARYLRQALDRQSFPDFIRESAETQYRRAVAYSEPSHLSGTVTVGTRYDSNVTQTPVSSSILLFGLPARPTPVSAHPNAFGLAGSFGVNHVYLPEGLGFGLESNASGLGVIEQRNRNFDVGFVSFDTGPRFELGSFYGGDVTIRPFGAVSNFVYGRSEYYVAPSAGQSVRWTPNDVSAIDVTGLYQYRQFYNSAFRPTSSLETADVGLISISYRTLLLGTDTVTASIGGLINRATAPFFSYDSFLVGAAYSKPFKPPLPIGDSVWTANLSVRYSNSPYLAADPTVSPIIRDDQLVDMIASVGIPLTQNVALGIGFEYLRNKSNLPNFSFDDKAGFVNIAFSF